MRKRNDYRICDLNSWKDGHITSKIGGYKGAASLKGMIGSGFAYVKFMMSIGLPRADLE